MTNKSEYVSTEESQAHYISFDTHIIGFFYQNDGWYSIRHLFGDVTTGNIEPVSEWFWMQV